MFFKRTSQPTIAVDRVCLPPELPFEAEEIANFQLPALNLDEFQAHMDNRVEFLTAKVNAGDFDSANTQLIVYVFETLCDELEANLADYISRSRIAVMRMAHELSTSQQVREEAHKRGMGTARRFDSFEANIIPFPGTNES